jgi:hypothetical protein
MVEALDRGDPEAAGLFAKRLRREVLSMRQNYDGWEATLLAWIERRNGVPVRDAAVEAIDRDAPGSLPFEIDDDAGDRWRAVAAELRAAIDERSFDRARKLGAQLHAEGLAYHDRGMARIADALSFIGRRFGTDLLEEAYKEAMSSDLLGDADFRDRAEALMHFTRVHLQPFHLEEDDEKLTFLCDVCPSGGRLLQAGHYDGPDAALVVEGARPLTYQRDSLPVYCCHEPIMERASIEKTGVPLFIVDPSEDLGRVPCKTYLYKNPDDIPERFYTRLGLTKPNGQPRTRKSRS